MKEKSMVPKKRGRPKKIAIEIPKKRGRPKKIDVAPVIKRKRGRPKKTKVITNVPTVAFKKRGRPKKIAEEIKKVEKPVETVIFKKRGRPKKIKTDVKEELPPSNMKKYSFLGHCPKCHVSVCSNDLESKFIYTCPACGKRNRTKALKAASIFKPKDKREYYSTPKMNYNDMPPMQDPELKPDDLKIAE